MRRVLRTDYTRGERLVTRRGYASRRRARLEFRKDVADMERAEAADCLHARWEWLDCDDCRETIGACGEKVCEDCGATI